MAGPAWKLPDDLEGLRALARRQHTQLVGRDALVARQTRQLGRHRDLLARRQRQLDEKNTLVVQHRELLGHQARQLDEKEALLVQQQQQLEEKGTLLDRLRQENELLRSHLRLARHRHFGRKSEQIPVEQLRLFNEAEATVETPAPEASSSEESTRARRPRGRRRLPAHLPRRRVHHALPPQQQVCPHDGTPLRVIGEEITEQLEFLQPRLRVVQHVRPKYSCPQCREGVVIAPLPPQPIPKSQATPSLLAMVTMAKYGYALPLYRQADLLRWLGGEVSRATLASWMVKMGALVQPLVDRLREELLASGFVQCDETRFQVLQQPDKPATSDSYLWVQRGGSRDHPLLRYECDPSRGGDVAKRLFANYRGILQTDGCASYGQVGGVVHAGCWAHARRKFVEALQAAGDATQPNDAKQAGAANNGNAATQGGATGAPSVAMQALTQIRELYRIERKLADVSDADRQQGRQEKSRPRVKALKTWLQTQRPRVPPQSATGQALGYLAAQWPKLVRFLDDGRIPMDTNAVENAIRPFVVGRKNWLFAVTPQGARASANLYSLLETAKANGLHPYAYFQHLYTELPRVTSPEQRDALLPHHIDLQRFPHLRAPDPPDDP